MDEYISDPDTTPTNRMIAESYVKCRDKGFTIMPKFYPHFLKDQPELAFYSLDEFENPFSNTNSDSS